MNSTGDNQAPTVQPKAKYHHGSLRDALISASYDLVNQQGAENYSLADACRLADVSTAAPYRHFKDRDEILNEVCARGFEVMTNMAVDAVEEHGPGTIEAIVALGQSYVEFAVKEQGLFRLMFGGDRVLTPDKVAEVTGTNCFGYVIEQVKLYCKAQGLQKDAEDVAVKLWTFVHGASALLIDGKYERVVPGHDVNKMIASATPLLLAR